MTNEWLETEADVALEMEQEAVDASEDADTWNPEAGDQMRGLLLDVRVIPTKYGPKLLLTVKDTENKTVHEVWSAKALNTALYAQQPGLRRGILLKYGGKNDDEYGAHRWYLASEPHTEASRVEAVKFWTDIATKVATLNVAKDEKQSGPQAKTDKELQAPF